MTTDRVDRGAAFPRRRREDRLLIRAGARDLAALEKLVDALAPAVLGMIERITGDRQVASRWTAEVFGQVWAEAPRFDPSTGSARTWVMVFAHRLATTRHREVRDGPAVAGAGARDRSRGTDDPSGGADQDREAIELAYFHALTYAQVAERLGVSPEESKACLRRGLLDRRIT